VSASSAVLQESASGARDENVADWNCPDVCGFKTVRLGLRVALQSASVSIQTGPAHVSSTTPAVEKRARPNRIPNDVDFQKATMTAATVGSLNRFVAGDAFEHASEHVLFAPTAAAMTSCTTSSIRCSQSESGAGSEGVAFRSAVVFRSLSFSRSPLPRAAPQDRSTIYVLLKLNTSFG